MKAVRFDEYGEVDVLKVVDVPKPTPGPGQVLVQVKAAGINPGEAKIRMGLMSHGVDVMGAPGGFVSATHGGAEIEKTVHALRMTVRALKAEREVKAA